MSAGADDGRDGDVAFYVACFRLILEGKNESSIITSRLKEGRRSEGKRERGKERKEAASNTHLELPCLGRTTSL